MRAGTFLENMRVVDPNAKIVVNTGRPYFNRKHVKSVRTLKDGTISITLGGWARK